jgi:predicted PurR-regulated permease PerM
MAEASANLAAKPRTNWLDRRFSLTANDPVPFQSATYFWRVAALVCTIVMAVLMFGTFLYFARALLLPVLCAIVVGMTLGPYVGNVIARGVPAWLVALLVVLGLIAIANIALILLANPATEMLRRMPEIAAAIKEKLHVFDQPIAAFQQLQIALGADPDKSGVDLNVTSVATGILTTITPAAVQFVLQLILFLGTLFFFIMGRTTFRRQAVNLFSTRDARLRALKILNDIESNLSGYLMVVTAINVCLGIVAIVMAYALGLPYPLLWGALAFALNYVPYVGPGIVYVLLFLVGLLTYPTLLGALAPPATYIAITLVEGQFLTPAIVGRQVLQVHPLAIFLGIGFWAWLWGPLGAFLAMPILIVARVAFDHLYPQSIADLPD